MNKEVKKEEIMDHGTSYHTYGKEVSVVSNGEVIETFESSGCIYNDLGCCQGCYICKLEV